jgi:hypothetical protein
MADDLDGDLETMDAPRLREEVRRLRTAVRAHRDATGHDLCWHHPDLWSLLPEPVEPAILVPPWPRFLRGCLAYRASLDREAPDAPVLDEEFAD